MHDGPGHRQLLVIFAGAATDIAFGLFGVILSPEDICLYLAHQGVERARIDTLSARLQATLDDFLENWAGGS